ncbi:hypothetical protein EVJ58_g5493 [Rhodofomes roseus]|uniref:Heme haloperoxidase family profile domain-containing protein n=1 Tax=Rhodofomes roseus TaxID=34475 RepID=A0A4Y9YBJ5_9APHY|nr:hypothetical protein EVJ58_g5493 [Rhodofomes roseus]
MGPFVRYIFATRQWELGNPPAMRRSVRSEGMNVRDLQTATCKRRMPPICLGPIAKSASNTSKSPLALKSSNFSMDNVFHLFTFNPSVDKRTGITIEYLAVVMRRYQRGKAYLVAFHGRDYARSALARWSLAAGVKGEAIVGGAVENKQWSRAQRRWAREKLAADPFSWYLTHGGFYLLDQRRKRICLQDLSHHNCIEHNTSLVHPDFEFRDEYAPIEMHLHMLENLMRYSKGGFIMTSNDVARVQVARKAEYTFLMDKMHVEIGRGKMAVVLQLFNNLENYAPSSPSPHSPATHICRLIPSPLPSPSPPPPVSLPGVPNHMLCVFMLKSSSPMAGRPTTASGSCTPCAWPRVFADPYARSSNKTADRKAGRTRAKTIDSAIAALSLRSPLPPQRPAVPALSLRWATSAGSPWTSPLFRRLADDAGHAPEYYDAQ